MKNIWNYANYQLLIKFNLKLQNLQLHQVINHSKNKWIQLFTQIIISNNENYLFTNECFLYFIFYILICN